MKVTVPLLCLEYAGSGSSWPDELWAVPEVPAECLKDDTEIQWCHVPQMCTQVSLIAAVTFNSTRCFSPVVFHLHTSVIIKEFTDTDNNHKTNWTKHPSFTKTTTKVLFCCQSSPAGHAAGEQRRLPSGAAAREGGVLSLQEPGTCWLLVPLDISMAWQSINCLPVLW